MAGGVPIKLTQNVIALTISFLILTSCISGIPSSLPLATQASDSPNASTAEPTFVFKQSEPDPSPVTSATILPPVASIETGTNLDDSEFLAKLTHDTWAYLSSDWARLNHLPWSWRAENLLGGDFANPTEIGLLTLAWLAAYDMQRPWSPTWNETELEVNAILDQLHTWQKGTQVEQPHGPNAYNHSVFFQWYWIAWDPPVVSANSADHLVPSIDNAWLAASLITIREYARSNGHPGMATKADEILAEMDFMLWYHHDTHLFTWGDVNNPQGGFPADYYSNENRIINFVARALGQMTPEEYEASLDALARLPGTYGDLTVAAMAWDGSYFTYTTPALFIREMDMDYGVDTILPATQAQIAYAQDEGYEAWGLSDSYDVKDGTYVQQGAPPAGLLHPETRPGLITPHASALALITPLSVEAATNLQFIANAYDCAYDSQFGFRDSVMANPSAPDYGQCSYRFSALAQGWTFLALVNDDNSFVWRYFYNDIGVRKAHAEMFDNYLAFMPGIILK
jgi:hypothetical protein